MGLAEPRKRLKLSHDPRNLAWSSQNADTSYGHRMMTQQGWTEGQALGARETPPSTSSSKPSSRHHSGLATDAERLAAARVGIFFKDDNLGLGAKKKGGVQSVEAQRTGLDAFQGLLGRLNGKGEAEVREIEKKGEERRLEMFFRGRWGGMVFVKGGILVGSVGKDREDNQGKQEGEEEEEDDAEETEVPEESQTLEKDETRKGRRRLKEEKRQRKEDRRKRKEIRTSRKVGKAVSLSRNTANSDSVSSSDPTPPLPRHTSPITKPPNEPVSSASSNENAETSRLKVEKKRKRKSAVSSLQTESEPSRSSSPSVAVVRNGRQLLRARHIQAKRMVLADAKGLDQIFMR